MTDVAGAGVQRAIGASRPRATRYWGTHDKRIRLAGKLLLRLALHLVLIGLAITWLMPFLWMVSTSLKTRPQVMHWPPIWIPNPIAWVNYPNAVLAFPFLLYLRNTLTITAGACLGCLLSCPLAAYALSRIRWRGRDLLFGITMLTMMIPYEVTMVPLFLIFHRLGWVNTWLPLIVPSFFGGGFYIFLLRQFFMTIPLELSDAATIDGASEGLIFLRIILPLSKSALAVIVLFEALGRWTDFLGPLIYLSRTDLYTISLGLQYFVRSRGQTAWAEMMAASTLVTLPIIVLFLFTQRTFIEGITMTGIKG